MEIVHHTPHVKPDSGGHQTTITLQWLHNGLDGVSNHHPHHCLLSRYSGADKKQTSKLCVTGLCAGNSPRTGERLLKINWSHLLRMLRWLHRQVFAKYTNIALVWTVIRPLGICLSFSNAIYRRCYWFSRITLCVAESRMNCMIHIP